MLFFLGVNFSSRWHSLSVIHKVRQCVFHTQHTFFQPMADASIRIFQNQYPQNEKNLDALIIISTGILFL